MDDVFISYASEDRERARSIARALEARGLTVWWDREIPPGSHFDEVIENALNAAGCVVVLWTHDSVKSRWVRTEASAALDRDRLVPAILDEVLIPLEFRRVQAADLTHWSPGEPSEEFDGLVRSVERLVGRRAAEPTAPIPNAPAREAPLHADVHEARPSGRGPAGGTPGTTPWTGPKPPVRGRSRHIAWIAAGMLVVASLAGLWAVRAGLDDARQGAGGTATADAAAAADATDAAGAGDATGASNARNASNATPTRPAARRAPAPPAAPAASQDGEVVAPPSDGSTAAIGADGSKAADGANAGGPSPTELSGGRASDRAAASAPLDTKVIPIRIGDRIEDGVPVPGAGVVAAPFAQTRYSFEAAPRESVFARVRKVDDDLRYVEWRLVDPTGKVLFKQCLACGQPGVIELREGGRYSLVVGGGDGKTGTYAVQVTRVPPPDRIAVELGKAPVRVSDGVPVAGAGAIEAPGARDAYAFNAQPRTRVGIYLVAADGALSQVEWRLADEDGENVFKTCLRCGNPGVHELRKGGAYTLWVGGNAEPATGAYSFHIASVPPPSRYELGALAASARIAPGMPAAGAGEIEVPGAADVYGFSVSERTRIGVRLSAVDPGLRQAHLTIADEDGRDVYNSCLGCGDPGAIDLARAGSYTLTVHSRTEPLVGRYEVLLSRL
jgi:hypothetical protein